MDSPAPPTPVSENPPTPAQGGGPGANLAPLPRTKSRVYGSQLAKEGDVQSVALALSLPLGTLADMLRRCRKYKVKYKDLKTKVREIEKVRARVSDTHPVSQSPSFACSPFWALSSLC